MNKKRRKAIKTLAVQLDELRGKIDNIRDELESVLDEEREGYDNMPDSLKEGDKGTAMSEAIDQLDSAMNLLQTIDSEIDEAIDALSNAEA